MCVVWTQVQHLSDRCHKHAIRVVPDSNDAHDVAQEAVLFFLAEGELDPSWEDIRRVIDNFRRRMSRRKRHQPLAYDPPAKPEPDRFEIEDELRSVLSDDDYRFLMAYDLLGDEKLAKKLRITPEAVRQRASRKLKRAKRRTG